MSTPLAGYETTIITRGEMTDEAVDKLLDKIITTIKNFGGELTHKEDWGKRKLAFTISKETRGRYSYLVYTGKNDLVHEIERNLRIHENVLRFLTVKLADEFDGSEFMKNHVPFAQRIRTAPARDRDRDRDRDFGGRDFGGRDYGDRGRDRDYGDRDRGRDRY